MSKLVVLDPGHAKNTAGKKSFDNSLLEYEFNRGVAVKLREKLEKCGITVVYSCDITTNKDASLASRTKLANTINADLFVSLHANAYGESWNNANGWEIYYYPGSSTGRKLAENIQSASIPYLGLKNRGVKTADFYVLEKTSMIAVLIEHGFYTNKTECEKLKSEEFREKCAIADAKGICKYLGITYK